MSDSEETPRTTSPETVTVTLKRRLWGSGGLKQRKRSKTLEGRTPVTETEADADTIDPEIPEDEEQEEQQQNKDKQATNERAEREDKPIKKEKDKLKANEPTEPEDKPIKKEKVKVKAVKRFFVAMFAKPSQRKHKKWEDDGYIIARGKELILKDSEGKILCQGSKDLNAEIIEDGKPFMVGGKEVKILEEVPEDPFPNPN